MIIYHETVAETIDSILAHGLKRTSRGEKGSDKAIILTDHLLDMNLPAALHQANVSRDNNIYGYLTVGDDIVDIRNGLLIPLEDKINDDTGVLLQINVRPERCYVSDLDVYDTVKSAITKHTAADTLKILASYYWNTLVRLDKYESGQIARPEVMITYDISPSDIAIASTD